MVHRVDFKGQPLLDPFLQMRILRLERIAKDADRRAAIDLFQAIQDRAEDGFIFGRRPHIIDGEDDNRFHTWLTHPLRRSEPRKRAADVKWIVRFEMEESVAFGEFSRVHSRGQESRGQKNSSVEHTRRILIFFSAARLSLREQEIMKSAAVKNGPRLQTHFFELRTSLVGVRCPR